MKKLILLAIVAVLAGLLAYRLLSKKEAAPEVKKDQPLSIGKNSGVFDTSFAIVLNHYYDLKNALVEWDTVKADQIAYALSQKADSLPVKGLKADSNIVLTAQSLAASIGSEAKGLMGETGIEQKRRSFNMLTEELYNLIRVVRYDGGVVYHMRCPMAFNDSVEAFWLDRTSTVANPYLGKFHPTYKNKMLGCGEVSDSLDFRGK